MAPNQCPGSSKRIAIVGGGVAGIACSWKLRELDCTVDIYEAGDRLGGHANSVMFRGNGRSVNVDTGFIAINETSYPQFNAFLRSLGVGTIPTDMSFGVATIDGTFEWGSTSFQSFVGKWSRLCSPWFWRLAFDIIRFTWFASDVLVEAPNSHGDSRQETLLDNELDEESFESIGHYLQRKRYSDQFLRLFLIPMVAAPWCTDPDEFSKTFPAKYLIHFMSQHKLLDFVSKTLRWRSFQNGSRTYVDAFQASLPAGHTLHLGSSIQRISRGPGPRASLELASGGNLSYDHVVLAVHANQALNLLKNEATKLECSILSSFETSKNICYLHSDESLLPQRASARTAWNCLLKDPVYSTVVIRDRKDSNGGVVEPRRSKISITFDMNKLQAIPFPGQDGSPGRVLVTMNPIRTPRSPQSHQIYYHPVISCKSMLALHHLHKINGTGAISFAGAWMGYGFHEDGFAAGVCVASMLIYGRENMAPIKFGISPGRTNTGINVWGALMRALISIVQYFCQLE